MVIAFLVILVSAGLIQTLVELGGGEGLRALDVFRRYPSAAHLRNYERELEEASVVGGALRPWFQFAQFTWLQDGGAKVLVGRDGWLFYKPGFDDLVARPGRSPSTVSNAANAIVAWRDALAVRGIRLLVVPVPNKECVYPDRLTRRMPAGRSLISPMTQDLLNRLDRAGVEYVNLAAVFAEARTHAAQPGLPPLYLTQDSHWSPAGVSLAAQRVAQRLVELGWVKPGRTEFRERAAPVARLGDVLRMMQSTRLERSVVPEQVPCVQVMQPDRDRPYEDRADSEVLVLGDSFLRIYEQDEPGSAGFVAHLARALKQPLTSLVSDGGASTLVRQELHRRPGLLEHKRVVVWEFVERDIRLGTEGWQQVPLPGSPQTPNDVEKLSSGPMPPARAQPTLGVPGA